MATKPAVPLELFVKASEALEKLYLGDPEAFIIPCLAFWGPRAPYIAKKWSHQILAAMRNRDPVDFPLWSGAPDFKIVASTAHEVAAEAASLMRDIVFLKPPISPSKQVKHLTQDYLKIGPRAVAAYRKTSEPEAYFRELDAFLKKHGAVLGKRLRPIMRGSNPSEWMRLAARLKIERVALLGSVASTMNDPAAKKKPGRSRKPDDHQFLRVIELHEMGNGPKAIARETGYQKKAVNRCLNRQRKRKKRADK